MGTEVAPGLGHWVLVRLAAPKLGSAFTWLAHLEAPAVPLQVFGGPEDP